MKGKHTPGDWEITGYLGEHDEAGAVIKCNGKHICTTHGDLRQHSSAKEWEQYYANAQLISAAPEMFEALLMAKDLCDNAGQSLDSELYKKIEVAFNKIKYK